MNPHFRRSSLRQPQPSSRPLHSHRCSLRRCSLFITHHGEIESIATSVCHRRSIRRPPSLGTPSVSETLHCFSEIPSQNHSSLSTSQNPRIENLLFVLLLGNFYVSLIISRWIAIRCSCYSSLVRLRCCIVDVVASICAAGDYAYGRPGVPRDDDDVVIVAAYRTTICKAKRGDFKDTLPDDLLASVLKTRFNRIPRNNDECVSDEVRSPSLFPRKRCPLGGKIGDLFMLYEKTARQAHAYLLNNCDDEIEVYMREDETAVNDNNPRRTKWEKAKDHSQQFHTRQCNARRKTQNSSVTLEALTTSYASAKDKNLVEAKVTYYGRIADMFELDYYGQFKVVLFKLTRSSKKGKEIDPKSQSTIDELKSRIEVGENHEDAFVQVLGKDQSGRVRCYGASITKSSLKKHEEIRQVVRAAFSGPRSQI
ncbi:hypothetical protein PIB30_068636 [Stylosanthes scabra]|uniref:Uncharacterized protein n=1 Tax=Stylosanthes scabra TaxID=79078 RepID=A0ABU6UQT6_9FABA|nr:hypothetical protein [Stylosanthes scabra]